MQSCLLLQEALTKAFSHAWQILAVKSVGEIQVNLLKKENSRQKSFLDVVKNYIC